VGTKEETSVEAVARLVALYRKRPSLRVWATTEPPPDTVQLVLRNPSDTAGSAIVVASVAHTYMRAPLTPTAAVVYLILDEGYRMDTVVRFLIPQSADPPVHVRDMSSRDPRASLARIMLNRHAQHEPHADYEAMAYLIRAFNYWVAGKHVQAIRWQPDWGLPRVTRAYLRRECPG
jgi:hypothetical protein